jgi:hypothetical protein
MGTGEVALMAWRIVKQPDGLYARFADPVDHFTAYNMTRDEALQECIEVGCSTAEAEVKLEGADEDITMSGGKGRWADSVETIRVIHGEGELEKFLQLLDIQPE